MRLLIILIIIFFVAIVSPHLAGKLQRKTDENAGWLKRCAEWLWDPLEWIAKFTIEWTRKGIVYAADWGKRTRWAGDRKARQAKEKVRDKTRGDAPGKQ